MFIGKLLLTALQYHSFDMDHCVVGRGEAFASPSNIFVIQNCTGGLSENNACAVVLGQQNRGEGTGRSLSSPGGPDQN